MERQTRLTAHSGLSVFALGFCLMVLLCSTIAIPTFAADRQVDYLKQVKPILEHRCAACHGALKQESGLRLDSGSFIMKGSEGGPVVVAGDSVKSSLVARIESTDDTTRMPPKGEGTPLTAAEIATLKTWIAQGAKYPENEPPPADPRAHWAFQRPVQGAIDPAIASSEGEKSGTGNPIDFFEIGRAHV